MSRAASRHPRGFTLVEMMIVLVLMVVMALLVAQLGSQWSDNARLARVQAQLQHAYDSTKSAALQNPTAATRGEGAATLCVLDGAFAVVLGDDCGAQPVWSFAHEGGVSVSLAEPDSRCIALDSAGVVVAAAGCSTDLRFSITTGSAHVQGKSF
ncbi:pilus assembly FimT family protein [Rubrivivax gelatinosus]|nr:prepilin-type N-terminal cleavage/methylation domain-containing protein [Rubrivivax gelatinosus]MBG6079046.1 prepilin-type N-terminal cleavage/methylation domain-containing protein [Rubrivivax gelatinosus]